MKKTKFTAIAAITLDGFIAKNSNQKTTWTSKEDKKQLKKLIKQSDVLFLGKKTYNLSKKILKKRNCIVLTRKIDGIEKKNKLLTFINPEKIELKKFIEKNGYKTVCILGGKSAYSYCLKKNLIDEIYLTIEPIIFKKGITMFEQKNAMKQFQPVSIKKLNKKGTLFLKYKIKK